MSQFTCNSCGVAFQTSLDQHVHMRTEWHRYNLKRRVAQLPAIPEDSFNTKVAHLQLIEDAERKAAEEKFSKGRKGGKSEDNIKKTVTKKEQRRREKEAIAEKRRIILEQARLAMSNKQEPLQREESNEDNSIKVEKDNITDPLIEEKSQTPDQELTEEQLMQQKLANYEKIPENTCLFSGRQFDTFEESLIYMFKNYGFYIPEQKYLVDKLGLVSYLAEKIALGNVCLCCHYQGRSLEAVRAHMISKRHCRIPYESDNEKLEISEFYDFRSTYAEIPEVPKSPRPEPIVVTEGDEGEENDGEWEDVSGSDDEEEDEILPQELSYDNGYELHLPSGAVVGHRSLMRYYRQNVLPEKILSEGQGTVVAAETRHMAKTYDKKELALRKRTWKREIKAKDSYDRKAAKFVNNQPYYRDQLLQ